MIANADTLYLSPDRFLNATPFAALYDGRQFLIEKHRLVLAPSGTFLQRRAQRLRREMRPALIIADPTSSFGGSRLDAARRAALELKELYDAPPPFVGPVEWWTRR